MAAATSHQTYELRGPGTPHAVRTPGTRNTAFTTLLKTD